MTKLIAALDWLNETARENWLGPWLYLVIFAGVLELVLPSLLALPLVVGASVVLVYADPGMAFFGRKGRDDG